MALQLKPVEAARGALWVRDAFRLFAQRPLAFSMLFVVFMSAELIVGALPLVGPLLQMMAVPALSLGFMIACQSALLNGRINPTQFVEPFRNDATRRRALLNLCILYAVAALAIVWLSSAISDNGMQRLMQLMSREGGAPEGELEALLAEPGLTASVLVACVLGSLLSVPFWHAPALVHWGGHSAGQALFSSTLAVWRSKGAFLVYGLCWIGLSFAAAIAMTIVAQLGARPLATAMALAGGLLFSTVFYVSLLFTFNDSFGGAYVAPELPL